MQELSGGSVRNVFTNNIAHNQFIGNNLIYMYIYIHRIETYLFLAYHYNVTYILHHVFITAKIVMKTRTIYLFCLDT